MTRDNLRRALAVSGGSLTVVIVALLVSAASPSSPVASGEPIARSPIATGRPDTLLWTQMQNVDLHINATSAMHLPTLRGQVIAGDARGAVLGWDVIDGATPATAVAVFSLHPRLETSGYVPRKFIQAEPLLEHGLALGVAYVDAISLMRTMSAPQGKQ